jgi:hypothetical protein
MSGVSIIHFFGSITLVNTGNLWIAFIMFLNAAPLLRDSNDGVYCSSRKSWRLFGDSWFIICLGKIITYCLNSRNTCARVSTHKICVQSGERCFALPSTMQNFVVQTYCFLLKLRDSRGICHPRLL